MLWNSWLWKWTNVFESEQIFDFKNGARAEFLVPYIFLHAFLTEDDFSTYNFAFSCSPFLNYQTFFSLCAKLKIGGCSFFQKMQYFRRIKLSTIFFGIFLINIDQPMCFEAPRLNRFLWNRNFTFVLYRNNNISMGRLSLLGSIHKPRESYFGILWSPYSLAPWCDHFIPPPSTLPILVYSFRFMDVPK